MALTAAEVFRDFVTDGVPSSGKYDPRKVDIRAWAKWLEDIVSVFTASGGLIYDSRASLLTDLDKPSNAMAWVVGDATAANNGVYLKTGSSGTGSWNRKADLPYSFIVASDSGAGTPDAIQATTSLPISGSALVLLNIFDTNVGTPVIVSFNGSAPLTIKSNSGNDIVPGGLQSGMLVMGRASGASFRLVSDQISSAVISQMEAILNDAVDRFAEETQALRDDAENSANSASSFATEAAMYADILGRAVYDFNTIFDPATPGLDWNNNG